MLFNIHKLEELKSMLNDITDSIIPFDSNILASTKSKAVTGPNKSIYLLAIFHANWSTFPFSQSQGRESIAAKLVANMIQKLVQTVSLFVIFIPVKQWDTSTSQ